MCVNLLKIAGSAGVPGGGAMQAAGSVLNVVTSLAGGIGANKAAKAEAAMAKMQGQMRARQIRRAAAREVGSARAAAAASGVSVASGSVLEAEREIERYSEQDALSAILTGDARASAVRAEGRAAMTQGLVSAGESLLEAGDAWQRTRRKRSAGGVSEELNRMDWR